MPVDATVKLRTTAGTLLKDLSTGGFWVGPVEEGGVNWRRDPIVSPFVDGSSLVSAAKDVTTLAFPVRCEGTTWATVEGLRADLEGWLEEWSYLIEVYADGVSRTYTAEPADITPEPLTAPFIHNKARQFAVSVPVQPNPAVT